MRYFFHIFDGPKVFPDKIGNRLSSPEVAILKAKIIAAELNKGGEFCRSNVVLVLDENGNNIFGCRVSQIESAIDEVKYSAATSVQINRLKKPALTPRGWLVGVTGGSIRLSTREKWFAVGIHLRKAAEAAVCNLLEVKSSDVVSASRPLKPVEIVTLSLRRGQVVLWSSSGDSLQ